MFDFLKKNAELNTTKTVVEIETEVFAHIKQYGFKKTRTNALLLCFRRYFSSHSFPNAQDIMYNYKSEKTGGMLLWS